MRTILIFMFTCLLCIANVTTAWSSDQCAAYRETYGAKDKRLAALNELFKSRPTSQAITEKQQATIKVFVEFIYASRQYDCGIAKVSQALQTFYRPDSKFWLHMVRADLHYRSGQLEKSKDDYAAMIFYGGTPLQYSKYAWLLATAPSDDIRDGTAALEMARKALEMKRDHRSYRSMAASLAELGQFDKAVKYQKLAIRKFSTPKKEEGYESMDKEYLNYYQKELQRYQDQQPWRSARVQ